MSRSRVSRRDIRLNLPRQERFSDVFPYPCYFLCDACGWLEEGRARDPMRRAADDGHHPGPCPSCHATAWVDLRQQTIALTYREAEAFDRTQVATRARRYFLIGGGLASTLAVVGLIASIPVLTDLPWMVMGIWLVAWLGLGRCMEAVARRAQPGRARPRRWRRPLSPPAVAETVRDDLQGVVEGETELETPLGRDRCVAWSVQVWSEDGLMLDEQHHAALSVDGVRLPADSVALDLVPRRRLHPAANDEGFVRFMARRGLSPHDASLQIYESHLVAGVPVTLHRHGDSDHPAVVLSQAPRALAS
ncbi:hypothetical protein [Paraliomyxa miuraensis]|uniref:hypothetical protein n=1 Tax=Paraliomyxa miuraensis TaxID=376150 RepID=UPI002251096D|nr:hypothetical protein [Paraliomyxa miuraensis]MCX4247667.1 hypothetical protein [Paraliomyxa miuraensis]